MKYYLYTSLSTTLRILEDEEIDPMRLIELELGRIPKIWFKGGASLTKRYHYPKREDKFDGGFVIEGDTEETLHFRIYSNRIRKVETT